MIVDTSAMVAILRNEPVASELVLKIEEADEVLVSTATVLEASLVVGPSRQQDLDELLASMRARIVPFDQDQLDVARWAHAQYSRGSGSPARLNYGDCFPYALAKVADAPLLFIGDDFPHTDVRCA